MKKKIYDQIVEDYDDIWSLYDDVEDWDVAEPLYIDCDFDDDPDMSNLDFNDEEW